MQFYSEIVLAALLLGIFWLIARHTKKRITWLQKLFLPSSLIAGLLILLAGPQALGGLTPFVLVPDFATAIWSPLPIVLINIVFACLFLGKKILGPKETWELAGPQVAFGQTLAWGQYVVGILLTMIILTPLFGISPLAGALIEISFEGGHGTAAGLAPVFTELGFAAGGDLAIGLATIGVVAGIITGVILINWAHRTQRSVTAQAKEPQLRRIHRQEITRLDDHLEDPTTRQLKKYPAISWPLHIGYVAVAILLGRLMLDGLILLENTTWGRGDGLELMVHIPLFPLAMIGGVLLQFILHHIGAGRLIDRSVINRLGSLALDILIITAVGTLSLAVLGDNLVPFILLAVAGITWNVIAFVWLARRIIPTYWFERGVGDLGQSMGMTATGLLLMKVADPKNRSSALESFGYKQLFFEPVVGGGLFTAASIILISQFGPLPVLVLTFSLMMFWMIFGVKYFGKK